MNPNLNLWDRVRHWLDNTGLFSIFVSLPVLVYALPQFQTSFEEDIIVLVAFFYLFFRACNCKRKVIPPVYQPLLTLGFLTVLYGIGWLGLLRGYLLEWNTWLALYPFYLVLLVFFRPDPFLPKESLWRGVLFGFALFQGIIAGTILLLTFYPLHPSLMQQTQTVMLIPVLLIFPIMGCAGLISRSWIDYNLGLRHRPLVLMLLIAMLFLWSGNFQTWRLWYLAGVAERAWTPHRYDSEADIAAAEQKPWDAMLLYERVHQRLQTKGDIPNYLNWPFFMKYRQAVQAMRKQDLIACLTVLPPLDVTDPKKVTLLKQLYHSEFLTQAGNTPLRRLPKQPYWIDADYHPETQTLFAVDFWGRLYSWQSNYFKLQFDPAITAHNLIDFAIIGESYVLLCDDGTLIPSQPLPLLPSPIHTEPREGTFIDIESLPEGTGFALTSSHGEIVIHGETSHRFPDFNNLYFKDPVIADMELDPSGQGYYLLDIYGAVHSNSGDGQPSIPHSSPPLIKETLPYWVGQDMAVDLELDPVRNGLYIYNRFGEMFTLSVDPYLDTYHPPKRLNGRGVSILPTDDGSLYLLEANGQMIELLPMKPSLADK